LLGHLLRVIRQLAHCFGVLLRRGMSPMVDCFSICSCQWPNKKAGRAKNDALLSICAAYRH